MKYQIIRLMDNPEMKEQMANRPALTKIFPGIAMMKPLPSYPQEIHEYAMNILE